MITIDAIKFYGECGGESDPWGMLSNVPKEVANVWPIITDLVFDAILIKNGLASDEFIRSFEDKLLQNGIQEDERKAFDQIVDKLHKKQKELYEYQRRNP